MKHRTSPFIALGAILVLSTLSALSAESWWNKEWTARKDFTIDTTPTGGGITNPVGTSTVLVRLHQGNFQFMAAKEDGSDIRFVAGDDKTVLPSQIEKYDSLMNEAFVWVQVPDVKPGAQTKFRLYYGNTEGDPGAEAADYKKTYDPETVVAYHFAQKGSPPVDSSPNGNTAENSATAAEGSMIGAGIRLLGGEPIRIPASETFAWAPGDPFTWSAWIKPAALAPKAPLFRFAEGGLEIGLDQGVPYVDVDGTRTPSGEALPVGVWKHLAVVSGNGKVTIFVDGVPTSTLEAATPEMKGPGLIGGEGGFLGELDQLEISKAARPEGFVQLAAISQAGSEKSGKLLVVGEDEGSHGGGHNPALEHVMLFGDIAKNMMFDGWLVVFACLIMAIVGWTVAIRKFLYLKKTKKADEEFIKQWRGLASDLTALDHTDKENVKSLGGKVSTKSMKLMKNSPLYHIYHIGSDEIHDRQSARGEFFGLSARSIQAIRSSLDAGLQRELHRLHDGLVFLTISIAGGPYVGLLGTVMGVMITFAVIAKTGQVEVNSIAPGIASALLATVAGLLVAIPALFIYSYLSSLIKTSASEMQLFIDEFISKIAEFYPESAEPSQRAGPNPAKADSKAAFTTSPQ